MSFIPQGKSTMEQHEQERFDQLYAKHLQALKLQGKRSKQSMAMPEQCAALQDSLTAVLTT